MFSKIKPLVYYVENGLVREKKAVLLFVVWSFFGSCFVGRIERQKSYLQGLEASTADLLISFQSSWNFGMVIFPLSLLLIMKCKKDSLSVQQLLRYQSRNKMYALQIAESMGFALTISVFITFLETGVGYFMTEKLMNWQSMGSVYYASTGSTTDVGLLQVFLLVTFLYFIKYMIFLTLMDFLFWYPKFMFILWCALILSIGIDTENIASFYWIFSIQMQTWENPLHTFEIAVIGIGLIFAEYIAGSRLIRKTDIF